MDDQFRRESDVRQFESLAITGETLGIALTRRGVSRVLRVRLAGDADVRRELFTGSGSFRELAWSQDGRRLLVAWPEANQWPLIARGLPRAFAGVSRQLDPGATGAGFPRLSGWCCPG